MNPRAQIACAPSKPVMLYDGNCGFCTLWVRRWNQITGDRVDYLRAQDEQVGRLYPEVSRTALESAVHLVSPSGQVYSGAEAVFLALATRPSWSWPLSVYRSSKFVARSTEAAYQLVATHRAWFSRLTRWLWGAHVELPDNFLVRRGFLVLLGMIYFIAFVSLWVQLPGLLGRNGVLPVSDSMVQAHQAVLAEKIGLERFHLLPTWSWFNASDAFLKFQCAAGSGLALLLILGVAPSLCLTLMWLLYLSLTSVGADFLAFQWDNLLLETGFLAIFLGPLQLLPRPSREVRPSRAALWLLRLLLFKLMFLSGVVKLASGDVTWRNLTALTYHYQTQPLPNPIAWYAHQLPAWFQKTSCAAMFGIELVVPFFIFLPRRVRFVGAGLLAALQVFILLTGNYTFFNWLTLALCFLLLDDFVLQRWLPRRVSELYRGASPARPASLWGKLGLIPVAALFLCISLIQVLAPLRLVGSWTSPVLAVYRWIAPFRTINNYGLFATMTTQRPEIVIEGSADGREWKEYEFKYKPGDLKRAPPFVAPYQPRLDWQMWFAALGSYRENPWFIHLCVRLLEGSPDVLGLMGKNPFPNSPPKYVRARLYEYRFTTFSERSQTGEWWTRTVKGEYLPAISLELMHKAMAGRNKAMESR